MLTLIDGNSLLFRAYYGVRGRLTRSDGTPVNAVYGLCNMILPILKGGGEIICVFDAARKNWRNEIYPEYKANRGETPADLAVQIPIARDAMRAFGLPVLIVDNVEADDVIATLVNANCPTRIVTGDKDLMQLVSDCCWLYDGMKNIEIRAREVLEKFGVRPDQVVDVQALMGDSTDNIPGVPGIGPKKAAELISQFGSLDRLYENTANVSNERIRNLLIENREKAYISRRLAGLKTDVGLPEFTRADFRFDFDAALKFAREQIESPSLAGKIQKDFAESRVSTPLEESVSETDFFVPPIGGDVSKAVFFVPPHWGGLSAKLTGGGLSQIAPPHWGGTRLTVGGNPPRIFNLDSLQVQPAAADLFSAPRAPEIPPELFDPSVLKVGHDVKTIFHKLDELGIDTAKIAPFDDTMLLQYILHSDETDYNFLRARLDADEKLRKLYESCDLPLARILFDMERAGVLIDQPKLLQLSEIFHEKLSALEKEIHALAGREFNIASPKQLGEILFDELKLTRHKSTDADALEELKPEHPIAEKVLEWRTLAKLAGTYTDSLPKQIAADGRIHTTYLQTSTNTGRLSSRDPNLQNIPIKTEFGAKIRAAFVAPAGKVLVSADYSQIQLRLLAHLADVKSWKAAFAAGEDIHEATACKIFGMCTKENRRAAKTINFSIIYGISSFGLAPQLGVSVSEAKKIIDDYLAQLPEIHNYIERTKAFVIEHGYVETPWGRRIELPEVRNPRFRQYALRAAVNAPIQGYEADIMRLAMTKVHGKIIMQVHDEIVFECDADTAEVFAAEIKTIMESVGGNLSVPLRVDTTIGKDWGK